MKESYPAIRLEMPDDVRDIVLNLQAETKIKKRIGKYSQQSVIISIIREYNRIKKEQP